MKIRQTDQGGFTLLEFLLSMSVFTIGLLAILCIVFIVINSNTATENLATAVNLAQSKIDEIKTSPYAGIINTTETALNEAGVSGSGHFDRTVYVSTNTNPNYKTVNVTISWTDPSSHQVTLKTIVAQ
jgi:prepilin-type N-terminal cleavage/methylation domain-containing protein